MYTFSFFRISTNSDYAPLTYRTTKQTRPHTHTQTNQNTTIISTSARRPSPSLLQPKTTTSPKNCLFRQSSLYLDKPPSASAQTPPTLHTAALWHSSSERFTILYRYEIEPIAQDFRDDHVYAWGGIYEERVRTFEQTPGRERARITHPFPALGHPPVSSSTPWLIGILSWIDSKICSRNLSNLERILVKVRPVFWEVVVVFV